MGYGFTRRQFLVAGATACLTVLVGCGSGRAASAGSASNATAAFGSAASAHSSTTGGVESPTSFTTGSKVLVVYFSYTGHLDTMAHWIVDEVGGDLVRVTAAEPYPDDYNATVDRAKSEQDEGARPEIDVSLTPEQLEGYDTVFFGFPVWWYDLPMPMWTFLESYNFSGKAIIPFFSHEGSASGANALSSLESLAKGVTVRSQDALSIHGDNVNGSESAVRTWAAGFGYSK